LGQVLEIPFLPQIPLLLFERAEIDAEVIFKATKVDGVYDADPKVKPDARRYNSLTYSHVLAQDLRVMDSTAIALCKENNIPIIVFDLTGRGNISRAVSGESVGTFVGGLCEVS
jgi:uridylate kinase